MGDAADDAFDAAMREWLSFDDEDYDAPFMSLNQYYLMMARRRIARRRDNRNVGLKGTVAGDALRAALRGNTVFKPL